MVWRSLASVGLLLILLSSLGAPAAARAPIVAQGVVAYEIVKDGIPPSCAGDGPFTLTFDPTTRAVVVAGTAVGCVPIWSRITNCAQEADATIRCDKDVGGNRILITLAPDGAYSYLWDGPDFYEVMSGSMTFATG